MRFFIESITKLQNLCERNIFLTHTFCIPGDMKQHCTDFRRATA